MSSDIPPLKSTWRMSLYWFIWVLNSSLVGNWEPSISEWCISHGECMRQRVVTYGYQIRYILRTILCTSNSCIYIYIYIRIVVYRHKMQLKRCNSETIQILYVYHHGPELLDLCLSVKRVALKGGGKKVVQIGHASAAQRRSCDGGERGPWRCERMFFGPKKPVKTKKFTTQGVGRVKCLIVLCWEMCVNGWVLRQWQYLPEGGFPFGWREGLMKFPSSRMGDNMCNGQFHAHTSKPVSFDRFWYLGSSAYFNGLMAFGIEGPCFRQGVWMKSWRK